MLHLIISALLWTGLWTGLSTASAPAQQAALAVPAKPAGDPGAWVTMTDYPADALAGHKEGLVGFALDVDQAGNVASCRITQGSGTSSLDAATCALLFARAHFQPALDVTGKPMPGAFSSRIRWIYPARIVEAPKARALEPVELGGSIRDGEGASVLYVNTDGIITACELAPRPYSNIMAPPDICALFPVGSRYGPPGLSKGKPVKRKVTLKLSIYDVNVR
ncbi:MAG: periplasmic protein TonB [Sphingomonas bacterium]|jgi:protein TonB|uniref:energy transducer TonB n=1 Tax=Sphingomonas bacterium TaxID=1895847 RepID=UPI00262EE028|nr:energy transducer TonB [Sphingomonas bacterium]MDB5705238.1 periplasmic protein TonB [Sphingomonas bacterium]